MKTVQEVAGELKVTEQAVWRWIRTGKIVSIRLPGGRYRIPDDECRRLGIDTDGENG